MFHVLQVTIMPFIEAPRPLWSVGTMTLQSMVYWFWMYLSSLICWSRDKMATVAQTITLNSYSCTETCCNDLNFVLNMRQAIIWINDSLANWLIYVTIPRWVKIGYIALWYPLQFNVNYLTQFQRPIIRGQRSWHLRQKSSRPYIRCAKTYCQRRSMLKIGVLFCQKCWPHIFYQIMQVADILHFVYAITQIAKSMGPTWAHESCYLGNPCFAEFILSNIKIH